MEWIGNLSRGKLNTPEGQKWINAAKKYMTEETMRWVGAETPDGTNMAMISTYTDGDFVFDCAYDGKSHEDEIVTRDIDEALDWLMTAVSGEVHMSYGEFKKRVSALIAKAGGGISVCFNLRKLLRFPRLRNRLKCRESRQMILRIIISIPTDILH